jgi:hypothetical protein
MLTKTTKDNEVERNDDDEEKTRRVVDRCYDDILDRDDYHTDLKSDARLD